MLAFGSLLAACGGERRPPGEATDWAWSLPEGFPAPLVPADNPMSAAKVALGRDLFFDERLSRNQTQSCASCHEPARAFTDGRATSPGSTLEPGVRSAMSLTNVAYNATLNWANPDVLELEQQALGPLLGDAPVELGWAGREAELEARLRAIPGYRTQFEAAFPDDPEPVSLLNLTRALAAFERTLISGSSPYDRFLAGDMSALSDAALRGMELFFDEQLECFHCHGGFNFTQSSVHEGSSFPEASFHNTGLYNVDGRGAYPARDTGLHRITGHPADMGAFRAPTLRNIAVTAPYMHDGSVPDLEAALDHYGRGGRRIAEGPDAGDGRASFLKSPFVNGFSLTPDQKQDVIAFLNALTDEAFLAAEAHQAPADLP